MKTQRPLDEGKTGPYRRGRTSKWYSFRGRPRDAVISEKKNGRKGGGKNEGAANEKRRGKGTGGVVRDSTSRRWVVGGGNLRAECQAEKKN